MKIKAFTLLVLFVLYGAAGVWACSSPVYTIGDASYGQAIESGKPPMKLGPISAENVPLVFPKSFLEKDGSYGGGMVFPSAKEASQALDKLLAEGVLPKNIEWHIYEVDACWDEDVYELKQGDYRLNKTCPVKKRAE